METTIREHDPADKKARILAAARALFIANGYAGTSMSAVARRSGVTQSMIHHYYGSKQGLWEAVKESSFADYLAHQQLLLDQDSADVTEFIANALGGRFSFFRDYPDMARFLSWIQLLGDPLGMETGQETGRRVVGRIRDLQEQGSIRSDISAEHIFVMALALTTYWYQSKHLIEHFTGIPAVDSQQADRAFEVDVITLFADGLRP